MTSRHYRKIGFQLLCLCPVLLLPACERAPAPTPSQKVTLAVAKQPSSLLFFVALEKQIFEKYGLDVDLKFYPSGKRALEEGLLTGGADFAGALDAAVALSAFEHPEIRVLASMVRVDDVGYIVARADHGIEQAGDLRGRKLATQSKSALHFFLHQFLLNNGIEETDVSFHFDKLEALPELLASGQVDAVSIREPYYGQCLKALGDRAKVFTAPGIYEQTELLVTTDKQLRERPLLFRLVLSALLDAETNLPSKEETANIIARYLGISPETADSANLTYVARLELGQSLLLMLEEQGRWGLENQLVQGRTPNYLNLLEPGFLEALAPDRVTLIH